MKSLRSILLIALFLVADFGCDEVLPPRDEPKKFLAASLQVKPLEVVVDIDSSGQLPYGIPPYPPRVSGFNGSIELLLLSYYNEVLQDQAQVHGTIDVWLADRPYIRTTVTVTEADVDYPIFDPDGVLTLVPGDSVHIAKQWSHIADNGRAFFHYVSWIAVGGLPPYTAYYESAPVRFNAQATLQVFRNVQPEKTPILEFSLMYFIRVKYPP